MAAQKHPQGLLYLPSRKVDSHTWHQPGTSSAQQGVDRGRSSAASPGCSPPGTPRGPGGSPPRPHCQVTAQDPGPPWMGVESLLIPLPSRQVPRGMRLGTGAAHPERPWRRLLPVGAVLLGQLRRVSSGVRPLQPHPP